MRFWPHPLPHDAVPAQSVGFRSARGRCGGTGAPLQRYRRDAGVAAADLDPGDDLVVARWHAADADRRIRERYFLAGIALAAAVPGDALDAARWIRLLAQPRIRLRCHGRGLWDHCVYPAFVDASRMSVKLLRSSEYRRMRWKNGGGWTTELAVSPDAADSGAFDWRISIAEIGSDGPFSTFPEYDRQIALLDGIGMELQFEGGEAVRL